MLAQTYREIAIQKSNYEYKLREILDAIAKAADSGRFSITINLQDYGINYHLAGILEENLVKEGFEILMDDYRRSIDIGWS